MTNYLKKLAYINRELVKIAANAVAPVTGAYSNGVSDLDLGQPNEPRYYSVTNSKGISKQIDPEMMRQNLAENNARRIALMARVRGEDPTQTEKYMRRQGYLYDTENLDNAYSNRGVRKGFYNAATGNSKKYNVRVNGVRYNLMDPAQAEEARRAFEENKLAKSQNAYSKKKMRPEVSKSDTDYLLSQGALTPVGTGMPGTSISNNQSIAEKRKANAARIKQKAQQKASILNARARQKATPTTWQESMVSYPGTQARTPVSTQPVQQYMGDGGYAGGHGRGPEILSDTTVSTSPKQSYMGDGGYAGGHGRGPEIMNDTVVSGGYGEMPVNATAPSSKPARFNVSPDGNISIIPQSPYDYLHPRWNPEAQTFTESIFPNDTKAQDFKARKALEQQGIQVPSVDLSGFHYE